MLIEQMPIVKHVIANAEIQILDMTGQRVKITLSEYPKNGTQQMLLLISDLVCTEFGVSWQAIKSPKRYTRNGLVDARHVFMYIAHKVMGFTSPETGRYILKDHSSVLNGCKNIQGFIDVGDPVAKKINEIIKKLPPCE